MGRIEIDTADLEQWYWHWLHKGREIERQHWQGYHHYIGSLCPEHQVPMHREVLQGREIYACPFVEEHRISGYITQNTVKMPVVLPTTEQVSAIQYNRHSMQKEDVPEAF